jgi:hypothetical protein
VFTVDHYLVFVDEAIDGMCAIVTELGDELANARLDTPGANSPYVVLTHCLGVMEYWGGHAIGGRRFSRDRNAEFVASGPVDELVARARTAQGRLRDDLAEFDPNAPPRGKTPPDDADHPLTWTQMGLALHIYEELAQHRGQMEITRDVLLTR